MSAIVSVIIPTYNHAGYILETLESVFAQTYTDYEVIVINDGSPDDTSSRLLPLVQTGRIHYFEQPNAGQATARNRGLEAARGELIAYLDDDDLWPPDKLAWQVEALQEHPEWVMVSGLSGQVGPDGGRIEPADVDRTEEIQSTKVMFDGSGIDSPGQVLIRRNALDVVGGFDPSLWGTDDTDLWIRLSMHGLAMQIRRTALYYRRHAGNASNAVGRMFWNSVRMIRKNLLLLPPEHRGPMWRSALCGIYVYSGRRMIGAGREGGWRARWAAVRVLAFLFPTMLRDLTLARLIYSDLMPSWLHDFRRRVRRTAAK